MFQYPENGVFCHPFPFLPLAPFMWLNRGVGFMGRNISGIVVAAMAGFILLQPACVLASPAAQEPLDRGELMSLAQAFVSKLGQNLKKADLYLDGMDPEDIRMQPYFDSIADGEPMILQMHLSGKGSGSQKLSFDQPIIGIKQGNDIMLSLADFVSVAGFPIHVDGDAGKASGWFIREKQTFSLDLGAATVTVGDETSGVASGDVLAQDGDIFVMGKTLSRWFGFRLLTNPQAQRLSVTTDKPWPVQEKLARLKRSSQTAAKLPEQPFREDPRALATVPNMDVLLKHSFVDRPSSAAVTHSTSYTLQAGGDLLGHTAKATLGGSYEERLSSVRLGFSKNSEDTDLLGPLKANFYEFNDVRTVRVPFAGAAPQEQGFHFSNRNPYTTSGTTAAIDGDGTAGWDVEIYRNQAFIAGGVVAEDGRYSFDNIPLFAGENIFRIIQYGPQGEIREEERVLTVAPGAAAGGGLYDVSLSRQNTQTYTVNKSGDPDYGTLHLAATYERALLPNLTLLTGLRSHGEGGERMSYLHTGAVSVLNGTLLNADAALASTGAYLGAVTARRAFGRHNVYGTAKYTGTDYHPDGLPTISTPSIFSVTAEASGPLPGDNRGNTYSLGLFEVRRENGSSNSEQDLTLSTSINQITVSNKLIHETEVDAGSLSEATEKTSGALSLRGRNMGVAWRSTVDYDISPETEITKALLDLRYRLTPEIESSLNLQHVADPAYSVATLSANWNEGSVILSPSLSYDTDDVLRMQMTARFGLTLDPYSGDILMRSADMQDKGGVSAFVFLDRNGDMVFSKGDEPLEDIVVEAVQVHRTAFTDKSGEAFMHGLSPTKITDIVIQEGSTFDPNWVSGFPGVSLRPRPGHVARIEFPIHQGGEMDGTAWVRTDGGKTRTLRDATLHLYNGDGKKVLTAVTAPDGYYLFERIPPGRYWLMLDGEDAKLNHILPPMPRVVSFGFEGTILAGNDLFFEQGDGGVPISISPDMSDWLAANPGLQIPESGDNFQTPGSGDNMIALNLGSYHSRLLASLVWYNLKTLYGHIVAGAEPMVRPSDVNVSLKTGKNTLRILLPKSDTVSLARERCRLLGLVGFECAVEMLPGGMPARAPQKTSSAR